MVNRRIISLRFLETSANERLTLQMQVGQNGPVDIEFAADGARLHPNGNALFALGYLPACELNYDLRIAGEVSPQLLVGADDIFSLYSRWYRYRRQPKIEARPGAHLRPQSERSLLFFSGGVDSCYSLLEAQNSVKSLVTVVGADVQSDQKAGAEWVAGLGRQFAGKFGLRPIVIRTAARRWFDRMVSWDHFHGPFFGSLAHLLAPEYRRALLAGSFGAQGLQLPWGSHPDHERRYSSPAMAIEHHLPHTRLTKIRRLAAAGLTEPLRVCLQPVNAVNCGVCRKCHYLRVALRLLEGERSGGHVVFAREDPVAASVQHLGHLENWQELLVLAEAQGEQALADQLRKACRDFEIRHAGRLQRFALTEFHPARKRLKRSLLAGMGKLFLKPKRAGV